MTKLSFTDAVEDAFKIVASDYKLRGNLVGRGHIDRVKLYPEFARILNRASYLSHLRSTLSTPSRYASRVYIYPADFVGRVASILRSRGIELYYSFV